MKIPKKADELVLFCTELVEQCSVSLPKRVSDAILFRSYFLDGAPPGKQALFNKTGVHVDELASQLYSPSDVRFWLEKTRVADDKMLPLFEEAANVITDHYVDDRVHLAFAEALVWALVYGKSFVKLGWDELDEKAKPYIVAPYEIGVYREDYGALEDQEAICQTFYVSMEQIARRLEGHPKEKELLTKIKSMSGGEGEDIEGGFHRIFIGGTQPIITQGTPVPVGFSSLRPNAPMAQIAPEVAKNIVKMYELWVWDDDRDDWTTIQMVEGGIILEGELQHENLFSPGLLPFSEICPNPVAGYFWGTSEIAPIRKLQDALNDRIGDILDAQERELKPSKAFIGFEGLNEEKMAAARKPNGYIAEATPNAKIEDLTPKLPQDVFESVRQLEEMFDKVAGFTPTLKGRGEAGVRSQSHAQELVRQSSPRLRDRALLVEHQCADLGDLLFHLLQDKDAHIHKSVDGQEFYLKTLEDANFTIVIDAHSASPVFVQEAINLAVLLQKEGAIDAEDFLRLTHPPMFTTLLMRLRQRQAAHQKLLKEHPELVVEEAKHHGKR